MPLDPHDWHLFAQGEMDTAREQAALIACLYRNRQDLYLKALQTSGFAPEVLAWHFLQNTLPPSWATWRDGDQLGVTFNGTRDEPRMWLNHFFGVRGRSWARIGGRRVHDYFLDTVETLYPQVIATLGDLAGKRILISGHSFGAGIANLMGLRMAGEGFGPQLSVVTFGEPRSTEGGVTDPGFIKARIVNQGDLVTAVPMTWAQYVVPQSPGIPRARTGRFPWSRGFQIPDADPVLSPGARPDIRWLHTGGGWLIGLSGNLRKLKPDETGWGNLEEGATSFRFYGHHVIEGYLQRLASVKNRYGGSRESERALAVGLEAVGQPWTQTDGPPLGPEDYITTTELFNREFGPGFPEVTTDDIRRANAVSLETAGVHVASSSSIGFLGGTGMASGVWDVTFYINNDTFGKSQTFGLNGPTGFLAAQDAAYQLATLRARMLGVEAADVTPGDFARAFGLAQPSIEYIRLKDSKTPRAGQVIQVPRFVGNPDVPLAATDNRSDPLWNSLSISLFGEAAGPPQTRARYTLTIVGFPDRLCAGGLFEGGIQLGGAAPAAFRDRLKIFLDFLTNGPIQWGFTGQNPSIPVKFIDAWEVTADGQAQVTCTGHGYASGDRVTISRTGSKRLNRIWRVRTMDANNFVLLRSQLTPLQVPPFLGQARRKATKEGIEDVAFYRFLHPEGGWQTPFNLQIAKREPGRRYTRVSFPRRGRREL